MHYDEILKVIGGWGPYQKLHFTLISLVAIFSAWHSLNMVFVGANMPASCTLGAPLGAALANTSFTAEQVADLTYPLEKDKKTQEMVHSGCKLYNQTELEQLVLAGLNYSDIMARERSSDECGSWDYDTSRYKNTIVSEWDLVCDRSWHASTLKSVFFGGRLVGAFVGGQVSDRVGRRPVFFVALVLQIAVGSAAAFATYLPVFYVLYFLQGVMQTACFLVAYVLGTELVGPSKRKLAGFIIQMTYAVGYMVLAGIAYWLRHWQWILLAISLPGLVFLLYWWVLPESVRWLLSQGKLTEARKIMEQAAKKNGTELTPEVLEFFDKGSLTKDEKEEGPVKKYSVIDIFRSPRMTVIALLVWLNWLVNSMVYYGLALNTSNLGGNPYLNFAIAGAVEIPAYIACILLIDRVGRRMPLMGFMVFGGVCCIITPFMPAGTPVAGVVVSMTGKLCITASYGIIYLYAAEVFPTVLRNVGMGVSSMSARIGGILAPQILRLEIYSGPLPLIIYGILAIVVGLSSLILPETAGKNLPETVEDLSKDAYRPACFACCSKGGDDTQQVYEEDGRKDTSL